MNAKQLSTLKVGDKISGGSPAHYHATVEKIESNGITVCYSGTCKSVKILPANYEKAGIVSK